MPSHRYLFVVSVFACASLCASEPPHPNGNATPARDNPAMIEKRQGLHKIKGIKKLPSMPAHARGEVPEAIIAITREDLAKRLGHDEMHVKLAQAVVWSSGARGCPKPDIMYPQGVIHGYHIVFAADGKMWDYRMNEGGHFLVCENSVGISTLEN